MFNLANDNLLEKYKELGKEYEEETTRMKQMINLLKKMIRHVEDMPKEEKPSEIMNKLNLLKELVWLEELQGFDETREAVKAYYSHENDFLREMEIEVESGGEEYEQLVLPGCEPEEGTVYRKKKKVTPRMFRRDRPYRKAAATRRMAEIMQDLDHKWLSDFHRYLCTDIDKRAGIKVLAEKLSEWICEYPLQLLLALDESATRLLRKLAEQRADEKLVINEKNIDDYLQLGNMGLIDLTVTEEKDQLYFGISVPEEIGQKVLPAWQEILWENLEHDSLSIYLSQDRKKKSYSMKELQKELDSLFERILLMAHFYGLIEMKEFRRILGEIYQVDIPLKEFMRFVYLEGTFHSELLTGKNRITGETFIGMPELNAEQALFKREKYSKDIEYPVVPEDQMEGTIWSTESIWKTIHDFLEGWEAEITEIGELFHIASNMVKNGDSVAQVMEYLLEEYEVENPARRVILWRLLVLVSLVTPLPMLKGHSRDTFYDAYGKHLHLDMFRGTGKKIRKASLYELPVAIQEKLAQLAIVAERESYFDVVSEEEKLPKECMHNEEVKLFLFVNRILPYEKIKDPVLREREEQRLRNMATGLCEECRDSETTDWILKLCNHSGIINYISGDGNPQTGRMAIGDDFEDDYWNDDYVAPEPVVKPAKIYPNDPCPCGSGKKYKKCCGRKA